MMNNFERIKQMTIDEMINLLLDSCCDTCACDIDENKCMATGCEEGIKQWLKSEVENE